MFVHERINAMHNSHLDKIPDNPAFLEWYESLVKDTGKIHSNGWC